MSAQKRKVTETNPESVKKTSSAQPAKTSAVATKKSIAPAKKKAKPPSLPTNIVKPPRFDPTYDFAQLKQDKNGMWPCYYESCKRGAAKPFKTKFAAKAHISGQHRQYHPYKCTEDPENCTLTFPLQERLIRHIAEQHKKIRPWICQNNECSCEQAFPREEILRDHVLRKAGIKAFVCDFEGCEWAFVDQGGLTEHMRIHTGERPYICEDCGKDFAQYAAIWKHKFTHGERKFVCLEHNIWYVLEEHLTRHIDREHNRNRPYICQFVEGDKQCGKSYTHSNTLRKHVWAKHWTQQQRKERGAELRDWCQICYLTQVQHGTIYYDSQMCHSCLAFEMGWTPTRMLQKYFMSLVEQTFKEKYPDIPYLPITEDKDYIGGKECGTQRRQPDQGWRVGPLSNGRYRFIDGEFDENCHNDRLPECETAKMFDTNWGVNDGEDEVIFLRIGVPRHHRASELQKRADAYVERLYHYMTLDDSVTELYVDKLGETVDYPARVGVEYLFYEGKEAMENIGAAREDVNILVFSVNGQNDENDNNDDGHNDNNDDDGEKDECDEDNNNDEDK